MAVFRFGFGLNFFLRGKVRDVCAERFQHHADVALLTNQRSVEIHKNRVANHAVVGGVETFEYQLDLGVGFEGDVLSRELVVTGLSREGDTVANEDRALGSDNALQTCFVLDTKPTENFGFFVHLVREGFERNRKFRRRHRNVFERFDSVVQRNDGLVVR